MKKLINLLFLLMIVSSSVFGQNVKKDEIPYNYIKLPNEPLNKSITNYYAEIFAAYEADNKKKTDEYLAEKQKAEGDYEKEMNAYPALVKAAEEKYEKEMEEWNKKSLGQKVVEKEIMNENNKPVKNIPSKPYLKHVPEPKLKTSYDYPVVANTYLILDGFNKGKDNAVQIYVTIYGFDHTLPRQITTQKKVTNYSNGKSTTVNKNYYHTEFSYRHPMAVKVTTPDGKEILNITPQELNTYTIYKTPESDKPEQVNQELLIKTHEEKILQANLEFINEMVNDKIGFKVTPRVAELEYVKAKDDSYNDLLLAFNEASSGLKILTDNETEAYIKLQKAIDTWNTALKESDVNNKKARIDKEVTIAIYFNLLESYFAMRNWKEGEKAIAALNIIDLSNKERKTKDDYEALFNDLKKRVLAQKN